MIFSSAIENWKSGVVFLKARKIQLLRLMGVVTHLTWIQELPSSLILNTPVVFTLDSFLYRWFILSGFNISRVPYFTTKLMRSSISPGRVTFDREIVAPVISFAIDY